MNYACIAGVGSHGGRCRNFVRDQGGRCTGHSFADPAPAPDVVLLKFTIAAHHTARLVDAGVPYVARKRDESDRAHEASARKIGRDPFKYRKVADSGVPVFGKEGLKSIGIYPVFEELSADYRVGNFQIEPTRDPERDAIVVALGKQPEIPVELPAVLGEFIFTVSWHQAHVWANPRDEKGLFHTVNLLGRREEEEPKLDLLFAGGIWRTCQHLPVD